MLRNSHQPNLSPNTASNRRRLWLFRLIAAVGVPLLILAVVEGGLRLAGYGRSPCYLLADAKQGWLRTNPDFFKVRMGDDVGLQPLNFRIPAEKPPNTIRVVVLGESAAQGIPVPAFGFATQLRAQLRARYPGKNIEVINAGVAAISSHLVVPIAEELASYAPDVFVVYMGNNDIVGPYGPGGTFLPQMPPRWVVRLSMQVRASRTGQLIHHLFERMATRDGKLGKGRPSMDTFVEQATPHDDPRLAAVARNFEANLSDVIRAAHRAGAKAVVCTLASNLKDCAPLLPRHRADLPVADFQTAQKAFARAMVEWRMGNAGAASRDLAAALRIEPDYADTHFVLGRLALQAGDTEAARREFLAAIRLDSLGFRPGPRLNDITRAVAARGPGVTLLDVARLFGSDAQSTAEPAGEELFVDHVHFTWAGSYRLGRLLADCVADLLPQNPSAHGLEIDDCAAAVGFTPNGEAMILALSKVILQGAPFNNQLTHCEDLARLEQRLNAARSALANPDLTRASLRTVQAASSNDPANPYLAEIDESLAASLGLADEALAAASRRRRILPDTPELATNEAFRLLRVGRTDQALALLETAAAMCPPEDLPKMGGTFVQYFIETKQTAAGLDRLDRLFARVRGQSSHRLRADLLQVVGERAAAEREYRAALAEVPTDAPALEGLVTLLLEAKRTTEAENASWVAAESQPNNHCNNLRAAKILEQRGQGAAMIHLLLAAERSGPVNARIEMTLSLQLAAARRLEESLSHLALARRLAQIEQNQTALTAIDGVLDRLPR
jgi:tetratricopeptide (TPR) repeat protein